MVAFTIRVLKGKPSVKARRSFFSSIDELTESFTAINVLADSETSCDLELRWIEERTFNNVVAEDGITSIQISLEKMGHLSIRNCGHHWYACNLGRRSMSLSTKALASFKLTPIRLDLRESLSGAFFTGIMLENVRVSDLSVDTISSLNAEIPSCTQTALLKLVKGTDARVTSFAISPTSEKRLTFSTNGTVKVQIPDSSWEQAVKEIESFTQLLFPEQ